MTRKSSTFIQTTREREAWLTASREREGEAIPDADKALATAAFLRGVMESIPVPPEAEEWSRSQAVAVLHEQQLTKSSDPQVQAPWYLRVGHAMKHVFTINKKR